MTPIRCLVNGSTGSRAVGNKKFQYSINLCFEKYQQRSLDTYTDEPFSAPSTGIAGMTQTG